MLALLAMTVHIDRSVHPVLRSGAAAQSCDTTEAWPETSQIHCTMSLNSFLAIVFSERFYYCHFFPHNLSHSIVKPHMELGLNSKIRDWIIKFLGLSHEGIKLPVG